MQGNYFPHAIFYSVHGINFINETGDTRYGYSTVTSHLVTIQPLKCVNT